MEIVLNNMQSRFADTGALDALAQRVLNCFALEKGLDDDLEVGVLWVDDAYMLTLNREYRAKNCPTDVLSFSSQERLSAEPEIADDPFRDMLLGDIVISLDTALRQAKEYEHSLEREVAFLLVHGMLHLLGYDHEEKAERQIMRGEEEKILSLLGISR